MSTRSSKKKPNGAASGAVSLAPVAVLPTYLIRSTRRVRSVVIPGLGPDGQDAIMYHVPFTAGQMMQFQDELAQAAEIEKTGGNPKHIERVVRILSGALCDDKGKMVFTDEVLRQVPADILVMIMTTIAKSTTDPLGKPTSTAQRTDSPTA